MYVSVVEVLKHKSSIAVKPDVNYSELDLEVIFFM